MMKEFLFEDTFWMVLSLVPVVFVLWGVWYRTRSRASSRALMVGLSASALLLVVQWWVVTDREKLERTTRLLSSAVEHHDIDGVVALVDPNAKFDGGYDREQFKEHLSYLLKKYEVENPSVGGFVVDINGTQASIRCSASCRVTTREWSGTVPSRWELTFKLRSGQWLVTDLKPLKIAGRTYSSFFGIN